MKLKLFASVVVLLSVCRTAHSTEPHNDNKLFQWIASSGQIVDLEGNRTYYLTENILLSSNSGIRGRGQSTKIVLDGCSIVVDNAKDTSIESVSIHPAKNDDIPLLRIKGNSYRHRSTKVLFSGHNGSSGTLRDGVEISDSHDLQFISCEWVSFHKYAINVLGKVAGQVSCNSLQLLFCRIHGCINGMNIDSCVGLSYLSGLIEGVSKTAVTIDNSTLTRFAGTRFESNGFQLPSDKHVILIGVNTICYQTTLDQCLWYSDHQMESFVKRVKCKTLYARGGRKAGSFASTPFVSGDDVDPFSEIDERLLD